MRIFVFIYIFFIAAFAQAQSAQEIIENVKERYQTNRSFQADITFEIDVPESANQVMHGKIVLNQEKYRFTLPNQEIISDNKTIWHWTKEEDINEVQVSWVDERESVITPSKVFNDFLAGYNYELLNKTTYEGNPIALIEFIPEAIESTNDIFKIKVVANTKDYSLREMQIFTRDGLVYIFTISSEQIMTPKADLFTFKPSDHPDVEVIDLR